MNKIILSVAVVAIVGGGLFYFLRSKPQANPTDNKPVAAPNQVQKAKTTEPTQVQKAKTTEPAQITATETNVVINSFAFSPKVITIKAGEKVTWINQDEAPHVVKSLGFNSESLNKGDKFEFTFTKVGTFDYTCGVHQSMAGQIIVK